MSAPPQSDLPVLSRALVSSGATAASGLELPPDGVFQLPERAVQFGTGAFLRGFVEYFIDSANRQGRFLGRVVMIGSTGSGRDGVLREQDHLYTLAVLGMRNGEPFQQTRVIGSVSRALSAAREWDEVLACARNPELQLVFSNTTEVGIALDEADRGDDAPPASFPGKLARFLYERARAFEYDPDCGVVVLPCELIEGNGDRLRSIVLTHAARWALDERFAGWIAEAVPFCNTLVDRIVPGAPEAGRRQEFEEKLGYRDELLTMAEVYRLFAIQGDRGLRRRLGFADADPGVVVVPDVGPFRERKVRILNGGHTLTAPVGLLVGLGTVGEAVADPTVGKYVRHVLFNELATSLDADGASEFARETLDRWANPFLRHALFDITLHATMKMRVRVVPSILRFAEKTGRVPEGLAFGFAAHLLFLRGELQRQRAAAGMPVPLDENGGPLVTLWSGVEGAAAVGTLARTVCADEALWGTDLTAVPGFADSVAGWLVSFGEIGVSAALGEFLARVGESTTPNE
jgi:tagaturonate reductase